MKPVPLTHSEKETLIKEKPHLFVDDNIGYALEELFDIEYPSKKDIKTTEEIKAFSDKILEYGSDSWGTWVYYEWLNRVVHFPPVSELRALRSSRNRNLITAEEQNKLYQATILIIGMSVGSNIVEALISQGIGGKLILVDLDIIEPSNLNRIRSPYYHIGLHKVEAISRKVWEIDPYFEIIPVHDGLNEGNLVQLLDSHNVDIVVDEMDELRMKVRLREEAKQRKLPVIMAADDGDNTLIDIDRYDLNPEMDLFGGLIPKEIIERVKNEKIPRAELGVIIGKYFVGPENIPLRMYKSLMEVGKTLPSWPQLGGAAALSGVVIAYVARKIILNEKISDGRTLISLDEKLDQEQHDELYRDELEKFTNMMNG